MVNKNEQTQPQKKKPPRTSKNLKSSKQGKRNKKRRPLQKKDSSTVPVKKILNPSMVVFILLLIGCVFLFFNFSAHRVSGQSMEPTFEDKDRILIKKGRSVQRYEIITFEPKDKKDDSYIKRVIGIPGDDIWVSGNNLFLLPNGSAQRSTKAPAKIEEIPDGMIKIALTPNVAKELAQYKSIPRDHYFVQGDNRKHSNDSRDFGLVNKNQIEGTVSYRYFPFTKIGVPY